MGCQTNVINGGINIESAVWVIALTLFLGGAGLPMPENPVLMGGGYIIYKQVSPLMFSVCMWYFAILCGDLLLFAIAHWLFTRAALSSLLRHYLGEKRLKKYRAAFTCWGGWTLFLSRFTFGIRAVTYLVAGAAHYPWRRFLAVDGLSVAIQVVLFVGIGYYAGERIEWAQTTGAKIALLLVIFVLVSVLLTWLSSAVIQRLSDRNR